MLSDLIIINNSMFTKSICLMSIIIYYITKIQLCLGIILFLSLCIIYLQYIYVSMRINKGFYSSMYRKHYRPLAR